MRTTLTALYVYPIKSCRGIAVNERVLAATGLDQDRRWMVVDAAGQFVTQRECARMALIEPQFATSAINTGLQVQAPDMPMLHIDGQSTDRPVSVTVWNDQCAAFDEGDEVAAWFSTFLQRAVRVVRFDDATPRLSNRDWTGEIVAPNRFSDGFPLLLISEASLADLNSRLSQPLPMNRFRPNLVVSGLPAYGEDAVHELVDADIRLRVVKPCSRCKITTIDQHTAAAQSLEPLASLARYRRHAELQGVTFGQNVIVIEGAGEVLRVGQTLAVSTR